ncbi:MAG: rhomboid family intramembrane serine protease [Isosphaeraceae bacterium]
MRQIGSLPKSLDPRIFRDYLLSRGVNSRAIESADGWAIWIIDEDHLTQAREALEEFLRDPDDPKFFEASKVAEVVRKTEARKDREYQKNFRQVTASGSSLNFRRRPLTISLIGICVAIYLTGEFSRPTELVLWDSLGFFPREALRDRANLSAGLDAIKRGEVWRIITPLLLHVNLVHLIFNVWATAIAGTAIEFTKGSWKLATIVLVSAVVSNVGQYLYTVNFEGILIPWGGISGVVYALFGYIWMKGQFEPEEGMMISASAVRIMLLWLLLGMIGVIPMMANGAHFAGLVVGVVLGLARF